VPVLDDLTIDLEALRRMLDADRRAGCRPFLVVGNAGTVSTGAVDPLPRLAAIAREEGLWFHADGAYGAPAALCDEAPAALREGLALADSVAVDPHKWLYAPVEAGCTLVRHPGVLRDTFSYSPPYYRFEGEAEDPRTNYFEIGPQNSRGFRALKVWLALQQAGREGYRLMIGDDIRLARALDAAVRRQPRLEPWTLGLSIATFRYVPAGVERGTPDGEEYLNRLNEELLHRLKTSGEVFLSNAVVRGTFLLRACVVNFRTALADVDAVPGIVVRHGEAVDRELRGR
jgi:aromatic-L-amino-acid decarboxylase